MESVSSWWLQFAALTCKSWKVVWRRRLSFAVYVFAPPLSVVVLYILFSTIGVNKSHDLLDDKLGRVPDKLERCIVLNENGKEVSLPSFSAPNSSAALKHCVTVGYVPDTGSQARAIMQQVASSLDLSYGSDVVEFSDIRSMSDFMWKNPGHVDLAVVFGPDSTLSYTLWINSSYTDYGSRDAFNKIDPLFKSHGIRGRLLTLQKSVETEIIKAYLLQTQSQTFLLNSSIQLGAFTDIRRGMRTQFVSQTQCDEHTGLRKQIVAGVATTPLIATGIGISTIVVLMTLVSEKQNRITGKLRQMGLKESAHIASWSFVFLALAFGSAFLTVVIMKLVSLHEIFIFKDTSFGVLFVTLYTFFAAMIGVALIVAALFTKPVWIMVVSSTLFLGILFSTFTLNLSAFSSMYDYDESGKCFRVSNSYNQIWAPRKPSQFLEFVVFWFPWISYGRIVLEMYAATQYHKGFSFQDLQQGTRFLVEGSSKVYSAPSLLHSIWLMIGLWIVSLPLGWYLSQALAGRMNGRRNWNFPFQKGYWGYTATPSRYRQGDTFAEERTKSQQEGSLRVFKLSKTYKGGSALREVSVTMKRGEVFVLLGHNGAGKSTLINVLTGLTDATYGEAYFNGYSFKADLTQIQRVCGICPQFDALWNELNAEEHLRVCAAMQGLRGKKATEEISRVLEAVDLAEDGRNLTTTFSGGMKRRLSVCMAVLGDSRKLVFLDEPTTGVDTINKKKVWQLVEKLKEDKIVVLTTHNMEEADALGDKIAVLHQGILKAVGSSLFLKKEFGSGYQISLLLSSAEDAPEVEGIVKRVLPGAKIVQSAAGNLRVSLNHNSALAIPKLLTELQVTLPGREQAGALATSSPFLKEWGISNTTLEEVFLRLSAQNDQQVNEDENATADAENLCLVCGVKKAEVVTLYTRSGVAVKVPNAICLTCAVASQPVKNGVPSTLAVEEGSGLSPETASTNGGSHNHQKEISLPKHEVTVSHNVNMPQEVDNKGQINETPPPSERSLFKSQIRAILYKNFNLNLAQKKAFIFYILSFLVFLLLMKFFGSIGSGRESFYTPATCPGRSDLVSGSYCSADQFSEGFRDSGVSWNLFSPQLLTGSSTRVTTTPVAWYTTQGSFPLDVTANNQSEVQFKKVQGIDVNALFISAQETLQRNSTPADQVQVSYCTNKGPRDLLYISDLLKANTTFDSLFPSAGLAWSTDASGSSAKLQVATVIRYKSNAHTYDAQKIWVPSRGTGSCSFSSQSDTYKNLALLYTQPSSGNTFMDTTGPFLALNALSNGILRTLSTNKTSGPTLSASIQTYPALDFVSSRGWSSSGSYNYLALLLAMMGLSTFFPLYVRRLVMERQTGLLQLMFIAGMQPAAYWLGNYIYDFILSVAAGSIFFIVGRVVGTSSFADANPILCAIVILVWAHSLNGMSVFTAGLFKSVRAASLFANIALLISAAGSTLVNSKYRTTRSMPPQAAIFPPLGLSRILYLLFLRARHQELIVDIIVLLIASTVFYFAGLFINHLRASPDPFSLFRCFQKSSKSMPTNEPSEEEEGAYAKTADDIASEVEKVKQAAPGVLAIKIQNLMKVFPSSSGKNIKVAVDNLTLGLEYGEIFGLLGANGAGKTTALSMISGFLAPSAGTIEIGSKLLTGKHKISANQLSICPQSDVVWKDLSVWTHFMFYAYLKGLSSSEARASVQALAADLSLNGDSFRKRASSLSGGQLRRLSFGVSLVGNPSILLMDEITTGLDPVSRTTIWNVVKKQSTAGRLILLTTHSMEEADTLCTRIGIMSHGKLKCLGAPLYLKNRYSNGYTLTVVTEREESEEENASITALIQKAAPDAALVYSWRRIRKYSIKMFDLKYLFDLLEDDRNKYQYGIREWQIEQTTLQDVFLKVSEEQ